MEKQVLGRERWRGRWRSRCWGGGEVHLGGGGRPLHITLHIPCHHQPFIPSQSSLGLAITSLAREAIADSWVGRGGRLGEGEGDVG